MKKQLDAEAIALLPPERKAEIRQALETLKAAFPTMFMKLNSAQFRALKNTYSKDKLNGALPMWSAITFANGVGKTTLVVLDMVGWTMGPEYLNRGSFPKEALDFYESLKDLRDSGKLNIRLTCDAEDMKEGGSMVSSIRELCPSWRLFAKDSTECYRQIEVAHPEKRGIRCVTAVRTFDQAEKKHAGTTLNRLYINEPPPESIIAESVGRIRGKKGEVVGSIFMAATMLDHGGYMHELEDDADVSFANTGGHIYESCVSEEVTDDMAAEVRKEIGVSLEKNPDGPGYLTNGVRSKSDIDRQIAIWRRSAPDQLRARMCGTPIVQSGKIYPMFSPAIHVCPSDMFRKIPQAYKVVQVVDPHSSKPSASIWAAITPGDRIRVFDEWPDYDSYGWYDKIDYRRLLLSQECEVWKGIESDYQVGHRVMERIGDPNRMLDPDPRTGHNLLMDFDTLGFTFNISVNDNLDYGHRKVQEYLYYDQVVAAIDPNDPLAIPRVMICDRCKNLIRAIQRYKRKPAQKRGESPTEQIEQKFKDFADLLRYLCVWHSSTKYGGISVEEQTSDYSRFVRGAIPRRFRHDEQPTNMKGRRTLS